MNNALVLMMVMAVFLLSLTGFATQKGESGSTKPSTSTTQSAPIQSSGTSASAIATCGIKPPLPVGFWPDDAVCFCEGKKCKWVWMKR